MNKEQFKISISNLINYYVENLCQLNIGVTMAERDGRGEVRVMAENQAIALGHSFEKSVNQLIEEFVNQCEQPQEVVEE